MPLLKANTTPFAAPESSIPGGGVGSPGEGRSADRAVVTRRAETCGRPV